MNNKNKKSNIVHYITLAILVSILINSFSITALGIRPAKTELNGEETSDFETTIWVVNNDHKEFEASVTISGELGKYVQVKETELRFREDTDSLPLNFQIHLPKNIPPGQSSAEIIVEESIAKSQNNEIAAKIILKHKILVQGPYPDKYISTKLNFHDTGKNIRLVTEVENLGKKDLDTVKTIFYVNDKNQQPQIVESSPTALKQKENKLLEANINKSLFDRGEYEVSAVTNYEDQKVEIVKKLIIGKPEVEVTYFNPYFKANEVNEYSLDLLNKWNQKIENIFVDVDILKDGQKIDQFRTKSIDIPSGLTKRITDYLDARNKEPGIYSFEMIVNFWNLYHMEKKTFKSELLPPETIQPLNESEPTTTTTTAFENKITGKAIKDSLPKEEPTTNSTNDNSLTYIWIALTIIAICLIIGLVLLWKNNHPSTTDEFDSVNQQSYLNQDKLGNQNFPNTPKTEMYNKELNTNNHNNYYNYDNYNSGNYNNNNNNNSSNKGSNNNSQDQKRGDI